MTLALDNPLNDPDSMLVSGLFYTDWVMSSLFTIEMMIKVIALGFVMEKGAYLRDGWNILDFCVVIISLLSLFTDLETEDGDGGGGGALKSLRSLRAMRARMRTAFDGDGSNDSTRCPAEAYDSASLPSNAPTSITS